MKNLFKAVGVLAVLVLVMLLWPGPKTEDAHPYHPPPTNPPGTVASQPPVRLPPVRPRSGAAESAGSREQAAGVKAQLARVLGGDVKLPPLDPAVVEKYLERHERNAESLLGAFRTTQNPEFLKEAATRYPEDPAIQMAVLVHDLFPGQRREWLERLRQSAPDNSLPAYLSAREHLANQDLGGALGDLAEATRRPYFNPYLLESMQTVQELLVAGGRAPLLAEAEAMFSAPMYHIAQVKQLGAELVQLCRQYQAGGDAESAGALANIGLMLAARFNGPREGQFIVATRVGLAIEDQVLGLFDPNAASHYPGLTVQARREELARQQDIINRLVSAFPPTLLACSEDEIAAYLDRVKVLGEPDAMRWLNSKQFSR